LEPAVKPLNTLFAVIVSLCIAGVLAFAWLSLNGRNEGSSPRQAPDVNIADIRARAEAGEPHAQAKLGALYAAGEGITNSYVEAAKWFARAAEQGDAAGELGLGELYEAGQGVPRNLARALALYRRAAERGHARAQYTLGFAYESGRGVPQDHTAAAEWFRHAAEQGDRLAQYDLGQRYELGLGVPADKVEALKWFTVAANLGQPDAAIRRDRLQRELSREQVAEAQRLASVSAAHKAAR
jgi:TPR repeat protein